MAKGVERTATPATAETQGKTKRLRIEVPGAVNGETHERVRKGKGTLAVTQNGPHSVAEETILD